MTKPIGNKGTIILFILAGIILIPVFVVIASLFIGQSTYWDHIVKNLLGRYMFDTIFLSLGVLIFAILVGTVTAWIVTRYDFPLRGLFKVALVMPLAIPAYINAYTYSGIFDYTGPVQLFFRNVLGMENGTYPVIDVMNLGGAVFIMTLALYPYIYLPLRSAFIQQSGSLFEAGQSLGQSSRNIFFKIALPLARPALAGGAGLVLMEVLNEYGAVHYYGVNTFTTGIFRSWFALGDLGGAMKLAAILLIFILILLVGEKVLRKGAGYSVLRSRPYRLKKVKGAKGVLLSLVCFVPLLFGFILPVLQLLSWGIKHLEMVVDPDFLGLLKNSFLLAGGAMILILITAIFVSHLARLEKKLNIRPLTSIVTLGYAVPGAVIAIGIMSSLGFVDNLTGLFLSGSFFAIIFAYIIRYLAVAYNPVDAGFSQVSGKVHEAARILGKKPLSALIGVDIPIIRSTIIGAAILVLIDLLKELPLTMILRPFNFDTLATKTYELASDERLAESAIPALVIILLGLVPVILLNFFMADKKEKQNG